MTENKRPDLEINIGGRKIKMVYGLQMDIQKLIPDSSQVISLMTTDPYLRDLVVRRVMTVSKGSIEKDEDLISADELDLDTDEVIRILDWVGEHILHFFTKSAQSAARLGTEYQKQLGLVIQSTIGSQPSTSPTPSVGDSDVSKET